MPGSNFWGRTKPPPGTQLDRDHPLIQGLELWLPMSEGQGGVLHDVVGRQGVGHRDGTLHGGNLWTNGRFGGRAIGLGPGTYDNGQYDVSTFDNPTAQWVDIGANHGLPVGPNQAYSFSIWFNWVNDTAPAQTLIGGGFNNVPFTIGLQHNPGYYVTYSYGGGTASGAFITNDINPAIVLKKWHHLVVIDNGLGLANSCTVLVNGIVQTFASTETGTRTSTFDQYGISLGSYNPFQDSPYGGLLDNFMLWSKAIPVAEAQKLHSEPFALFAPPTWRRYFIGKIPTVLSATTTLTAISSTPSVVALSATTALTFTPSVKLAGPSMSASTLIASGGFQGLVAHVIGQSTNGNGFTTSGINTTGANLIVAFVADTDGSTTVFDSKGNTWTAVPSIGTSPSLHMFYARAAIVGAGHTFTTIATGKTPAIAVAAFIGRDVNAPLDTIPGGTYGVGVYGVDYYGSGPVSGAVSEATSGGTPVVSQAAGALTPINNFDLIVTSEATDAGSGFAVDSPYVIADSLPISVGNAYGIGLAFTTQGLATTTNPAWSWASPAHASAITASFKLSVSAPVLVATTTLTPAGGAAVSVSCSATTALTTLAGYRVAQTVTAIATSAEVTKVTCASALSATATTTTSNPTPLSAIGTITTVSKLSVATSSSTSAALSNAVSVKTASTLSAAAPLLSAPTESISLSPATLPALSGPIAITVTGLLTNWTTSTTWTTTLTGAALVSSVIVVNSTTSATWTIQLGPTTGTLTLSDGIASTPLQVTQAAPASLSALATLTPSGGASVVVTLSAATTLTTVRGGVVALAATAVLTVTGYPGLIAHLVAQSTNGNGFTTQSINTLGANLIVAYIADSDATSVLTDSRGNSWLPISSLGVSPALSGYYAKNALTSATHTFTVTSTGKFPAIVVAAFVGRDVLAPFDVGSAATSGGGTVSNLAAGSITPTQNTDVVVTVEATDVTHIFGVDPPYLITDLATFVFGVSYGIGLAFNTQSTPAATNPTWSWLGGAHASVMTDAFKLLVINAALSATTVLSPSGRAVARAALVATATITTVGVSGVAETTNATATSSETITVKVTASVTCTASLSTALNHVLLAVGALTEVVSVKTTSSLSATTSLANTFVPGASVALQATATLAALPPETLSLSPSTVAALSGPIAITVTGFLTNWTDSTVWTTTVTGASLVSSGIVVNSPTSATWTIQLGPTTGTLTLSDGIASIPLQVTQGVAVLLSNVAAINARPSVLTSATLASQGTLSAVDAVSATVQLTALAALLSVQSGNPTVVCSAVTALTTAVAAGCRASLSATTTLAAPIAVGVLSALSASTTTLATGASGIGQSMSAVAALSTTQAIAIAQALSATAGITTVAAVAITASLSAQVTPVETTTAVAFSALSATASLQVVSRVAVIAILSATTALNTIHAVAVTTSLASTTTIITSVGTNIVGSAALSAVETLLQSVQTGASVAIIINLNTPGVFDVAIYDVSTYDAGGITTAQNVAVVSGLIAQATSNAIATNSASVALSATTTILATSTGSVTAALNATATTTTTQTIANAVLIAATEAITTVSGTGSAGVIVIVSTVTLATAQSVSVNLALSPTAAMNISANGVVSVALSASTGLTTTQAVAVALVLSTVTTNATIYSINLTAALPAITTLSVFQAAAGSSTLSASSTLNVVALVASAPVLTATTLIATTHQISGSAVLITMASLSLMSAIANTATAASTTSVIATVAVGVSVLLLAVTGTTTVWRLRVTAALHAQQQLIVVDAIKVALILNAHAGFGGSIYANALVLVATTDLLSFIPGSGGGPAVLQVVSSLVVVGGMAPAGDANMSARAALANALTLYIWGNLREAKAVN